MSKVLIQCVVVLYKCSLEDSTTLQSLAELSRRRSDLAQQIDLLIYDNSQDPKSTDLKTWAFGEVEYYQAPENSGLAPAYNYALSKARKKGLEWLLLLDQDTSLNSNLFPVLFAAIESQVPEEISAMVPKLALKDTILSPQIVGRLRNTYPPIEFSGVSLVKMTALNSAASLRVTALTAIGGFPNEYWLDFLDHIVFHRLQTAGGRILVLDVTLQHRLALNNLETEMDIGRYSNVLATEWKFIRETGSSGGDLVHRIRLLKRALDQSIKLGNKAYAIKTLRATLE